MMTSTPIELLNSVFIYYVDKNKYPHKEMMDGDDSPSYLSPPVAVAAAEEGSSSSSAAATALNRSGSASPPPFNLIEVMNTSFHYFHNSKFKIGNSLMVHSYCAFPVGVSISKIEEGRFGNSLFVILFENGECFLIEKNTIHKIQIGEKILDISTTENHFICCSRNKTYHIKSATSYNEIKGLNLMEYEYIKKIETGRKFLLLLTSMGRIFAFGLNKQKQFGSNLEEQLKVLTEIKFSEDIIDVRADYDHTVLLARNGTLWMCGVSADNPKYKYNYEHFTSIDNNVSWVFFRGNTLVYKRMNTIVSIGQEMPSPNFIYYPTALFFKFDIENFCGYKNQFMFQDSNTLECYYFSTMYGLIKMDDLNRFLERRPYLKPRFYCSDPDTAIIYFDTSKINYLSCRLLSHLNNNSQLSDVVVKF